MILEDERSSLNTSVHQLMSEKREVGKEVNLLTQKVITLTEELADSKSEVSCFIIRLFFFDEVESIQIFKLGVSVRQ